MDIFESENLLALPRVSEIIANMNQKERENLKKITLRYIISIIICCLVFTILFVLWIRSMNVSIIIKWLFAFGYIVYGYGVSKIIIYLMIRKQKKFLESTEYARMLRIELE